MHSLPVGKDTRVMHSRRDAHSAFERGRSRHIEHGHRDPRSCDASISMLTHRIISPALYLAAGQMHAGKRIAGAELVRAAQRRAAEANQNRAGKRPRSLYYLSIPKLPESIHPPAVHTTAYQGAPEYQPQFYLRCPCQRTAAHLQNVNRNVGFMLTTLRRQGAISQLAPTTISPAKDLAIGHHRAARILPDRNLGRVGCDRHHRGEAVGESPIAELTFRVIAPAQDFAGRSQRADNAVLRPAN